MEQITVPISLSMVLYRDYQTPASMIRSLMQFTDPELQFCIIAVDNSDIRMDDTLRAERARFVSEFSKLDSSTHQFRYIDVHANLGFGKANNVALDMVDSQYHVFINPDILFISDALTTLKIFMDAHQDVGMCIPRMVDAEGNPLKVYRRGITTTGTQWEMKIIHVHSESPLDKEVSCFRVQTCLSSSAGLMILFSCI